MKYIVFMLFSGEISVFVQNPLGSAQTAYWYYRCVTCITYAVWLVLIIHYRACLHAWIMPFVSDVFLFLKTFLQALFTRMGICVVNYRFSMMLIPRNLEFTRNREWYIKIEIQNILNQNYKLIKNKSEILLIGCNAGLSGILVFFNITHTNHSNLKYKIYSKLLYLWLIWSFWLSIWVLTTKSLALNPILLILHIYLLLFIWPHYLLSNNNNNRSSSNF